MIFTRAVLLYVCILSILSHATCYVLLFPPEGTEQIEFIGRNSLENENIIFESSINQEDPRGKSSFQTKENTHQNPQKYDGESNDIEENVGKAVLEEVQEEEDGWKSRVMVNGKAAYLDRPVEHRQQWQGEAGEAGADTVIRTWLIHYCRLHPKCHLQTLLAEL